MTLGKFSATKRCSEKWVWGLARTLETSNEEAFAPMVAVYPDENAIAIWSMVGNSNATGIYVAQYR